jgi:hypothetical protein
MAEEIPHAYAYAGNIVALAMVIANLLLGKNWYRQTPLNLAGRLKCVAVAATASVWLLLTLVDDLNLSPSTVILRDLILAVTLVALAIVILAGDWVAGRFEKVHQRGSEPARRPPPGD